MKKLTIGTRSSKLALWQAEYIKGRLEKAYPELMIELKLMTTKGDKILDAPLAKIGGKGLFTKELEDAMIAGEIDLAVHSLKDMPTALPEGLTIAAITEREDACDALVSPSGKSLLELPQGAKIGTSSLRRKAQLLALRMDFSVHDLRGNVGTRLGKLDAGEYDAILLAAAGLKRLGFAERITEIIPKEQMIPAVGQGALAIETAKGSEAEQLVAFLNDEETVHCTRAERSFLARIEGGCQVPVGIHGVTEGENLHLRAIIASVDGKKCVKKECRGRAEDAEALGRALAEEMLKEGGLEILRALGLLSGER